MLLLTLIIRVLSHDFITVCFSVLFCFSILFPVFHSSTARYTEPAQRIVKAELVDYPQDEGPISQENAQQSKICLIQ